MNLGEIKASLLSTLWNSNASYYTLASEASESFEENCGLLAIQRRCRSATRILDCGCGEGTKLSRMYHDGSHAFGVDISTLALNIGRERFQQLEFINADLETLPFEDAYFDAVYIAYTLEHLTDPERVVEEMIRVTRSRGYLMFIGPNSGSPLFPSPSSTEHFKRRLLRRLWQTHRYLLWPPQSLDWDLVVPLALRLGKYEMDWDATVEPYLHALLIFLKKRGLRIIEYSSMFDTVPKPQVPVLKLMWSDQGEVIRRISRKLRDWRVPPHTFYGPNFYVIAQRT